MTTAMAQSMRAATIVKPDKRAPAETNNAPGKKRAPIERGVGARPLSPVMKSVMDRTMTAMLLWTKKLYEIAIMPAAQA